MVAAYRIRFAPVKEAPMVKSCETTEAKVNSTRVFIRRRNEAKSHLGCPECKRRHVKCDETFPVCLRCQRRGSLCMPAARRVKWQAELPWLTEKAPQSSVFQLTNVDRRLLQCWLEKTCQIMVLDPDINPMSFPIVEHLATSPSLVHALQSITAAHENFFASANLITCLQERNLSLRLLQEEVRSSQTKSLPAVFLSVFLLGVSSSWIEGNTASFGVEHLLGGRALIDLIIQKRDRIPEATFNFTVGCYIFWDMATSFLVEPGLLPLVHSVEFSNVVKNMRDTFHPIAGYSIEIFYILGTVGRYCRNVLAGEVRDLHFESALEEQMLEWQHSRENYQLSLSCDAFRTHGLIMLYRICGCQIHVPLYEENIIDEDDIEWDEEGIEDYEQNVNHKLVEETTKRNNCEMKDTILDTERIIRAYAVKTVDALSQIPLTSPQLNLQPIPLLTAGSELTSQDTRQRAEVIARFRALSSLNRVPANVYAVQLLHELWEMRDSGIMISWLELELRKGWRLSFA